MPRDLKDLYSAVLDESEHLEQLQGLLDLWIEDFDRSASAGFPQRLCLLMQAYRAAARESFTKLQGSLDEMQKLI